MSGWGLSLIGGAITPAVECKELLRSSAIVMPQGVTPDFTEFLQRMVSFVKLFLEIRKKSRRFSDFLEKFFSFIIQEAELCTRSGSLVSPVGGRGGLAY